MVAALPAAAIARTKPVTAGAEANSANPAADPLFNQPYIDKDEWRTITGAPSLCPRRLSGHRYAVFLLSAAQRAIPGPLLPAPDSGARQREPRAGSRHRAGGEQTRFRHRERCDLRRDQRRWPRLCRAAGHGPGCNDRRLSRQCRSGAPGAVRGAADVRAAPHLGLRLWRLGRGLSHHRLGREHQGRVGRIGAFRDGLGHGDPQHVLGADARHAHPQRQVRRHRRCAGAGRQRRYVCRAQ